MNPIADLIYHFAVIVISVLVFFMKFTAPGALTELFIKILMKGMSLFCFLYAGVQIFKFFGIV